MALDWNSVGTAPAHDEIELAFFGPGFGECAVVHVGGGRWVIVDSCVDTTVEPQSPVAESYLRHLGVALEEQVDLIVATHWHSDHVRGISRLVEVCRRAKFSCANSLVQAEFVRFVEEMSTGSLATHGAKVDEFRRVLNTVNARGTTVKWAAPSRILSTWPQAGGATCRLISLSPSDREFQLFLEQVAAQRPSMHRPKRSAVASTPNLVSVVLHLDHPCGVVLLGADMEIHNSTDRGWTAVITEAQNAQLRRAEVLKVPHHGSVNGHHEGLWNTMCEPLPTSVVTPFNRLSESRKLPTFGDLARLIDLSKAVYTTAQVGSAKATVKREPAVDRGLRELGIEMRSTTTPIGVVRIRRRLDSDWRAEAFHPAQLQSKGAELR